MSAESLPRGVTPVKSADRTVQILEYLSSATTARTLRNVSDDLKIPRASAYALLMTLEKRNWVESTDGRYRLGIRSLRASAHFVETDETVNATAAVLDELSQRFDETIHLARLDGDEIVYIVTRPSSHAVAIVIRPGRRLPATVTGLGKALLAARPWPEVEALVPKLAPALTPHTITSHAALREELEATRARGYALDEQESALGVRCVAVTVDLETPPLYAISCSMPTVRVTAALHAEVIDGLLEAKRRLRGYA
jgi:DNA-binding IclR family transcriptional regulator